MNGVSVQEFTERLLPILLKEIEVNHSVSEDPEKDKENSAEEDNEYQEEEKEEDTKESQSV